MMITESIEKTNLSFVICLFAYAILGALLLKFYQYGINGDGISLISIAQKYLKGDFANAINGYWGPLFSWLLIPFLFFELKPLLAARVLSLILGLLAIIGVKSLSFRFEITERVRSIILVSLIPIILHFALLEITADLLLVCVLIYYFNVVFDNNYSSRKYSGILCGIAGATAYLAKSYAFPFFVSHFLLFNVLHYLKATSERKKKTVLTNYLLGMILFSIISGGWICLLNNKYDKITIGTSGKYNHALRAPESQGHPMHTNGFLRPSNESAISVWEDPSHLKVISWSPLESLSSFKYQTYLIAKNIIKTYVIYATFSSLSIVIIVASILLCVSPLKKMLSLSGIFFPLITILLFSAGYTLIYTQERYLWINYVLLILMGGHLLSLLFHGSFFNEGRKIIALAFFVICFATYSCITLASSLNTGKNIYEIWKEVKRQTDVEGNVASNNGYWHYSLFLSYYLNTRYFGEAKKNISDTVLLTELRKHDIDYYFVWGENNSKLQLLSNYSHKDIVVDGTSKLKIYSLK